MSDEVGMEAEAFPPGTVVKIDMLEGGSVIGELVEFDTMDGVLVSQTHKLGVVGGPTEADKDQIRAEVATMPDETVDKLLSGMLGWRWWLLRYRMDREMRVEILSNEYISDAEAKKRTELVPTNTGIMTYVPMGNLSSMQNAEQLSEDNMVEKTLADFAAQVNNFKPEGELK